ncbi:MAG: PAS domain S-box protein [Methanoregulaceae archaeon]
MSWLGKILKGDSITPGDSPGGAAEHHFFPANARNPPGPDTTLLYDSSLQSNLEFFEKKTASGKKKILIVDDESIFTEDLNMTLLSLGYDVCGTASNGKRAIELVSASCPDLILMGINLGPGMEGLDTAKKILSDISLPIIFLTGYLELPLFERAKATMPYGCITKPYDIRELRIAIEIAFYKHEKDEQIRQANDSLEQRIAERTAELEEKERELRKSEKLYRDLADSISDVFFALDTSLEFTFWNPASERLTGIPAKETIGKSLQDVFPSEKGSFAERMNLEIIQTQQPKTFEDTLTIKGRPYVFEISGYPSPGGLSVFIKDITGRKQAEADLVQSKHLLANIIDHLPDATFVIDSTRRVIAWNKAIEDMTGVKADLILGKGDYEYTIPFYGRRCPFLIDHVFDSDDNFPGGDYQSFLRQGDIIFGEFTLVSPDEKSQLLWGKVSPLYDADRNIVGAIASIRDISYRKQMDDALRRSEERYRAVVEDQTELICRFAPDGALTFVNDAYCRYFSLGKDQCLSKPHCVTLPPEDAILMRQHLAGLTPENPIGMIEHRIIMPSGEARWQRWSDRAIFDLRDQVVEFQSVGRDITEQKLAEKTLRESEALFREVFNNANDIIYLHELLPEGPGRFIQVNDVAVQRLGYSREEFGEMSPCDIIPESVQKKIISEAMTNLQNDEYATFESLHRRKDGSTCPVEISTHSFLYKGRIVALSHARDITERKYVEDEIRRNQENLERLVGERTAELTRMNRKLKKEISERLEIEKKLTISGNEKDLLLREVHHRVKNNLQTIIGLIDITRRRAHEPAVLSILTDIIAKVQTMGLIHARLYESERFDRINMKQQVHDLVEIISGYYYHDHVEIATDINCAEIYLPVDLAIPCALSLNEVFSNIHKHAFKGRRSGIIEISSAMEGDTLRFVIRDNGVGLPAGFDIERSNRLGLKLIRTLVEKQLHGMVEIKSRNGTEVVIQFPVNQGEINFGTDSGC